MIDNSGMSPSRWVFIKNMLAIGVIFSHMVVKTDMGFLSCLYDSGTFSVAVFFFLSGYGVTFSVIHKPSYLENFFKIRILYILIMYVLATIVYVSLCYVCGINVSFVLWSLFSCYPILPYGWYFVVLLGLYVIFLVSSPPPFTLKGAAEHVHRGFQASIVSIIIIIWYIVGFSISLGEWLYMTTPLFGLGMFYAIYRESILGYFMKYKKNILLILTIVFFASWRSRALQILNFPISLQSLPGVISCTIACICFVVVLVFMMELYSQKFNLVKMKDFSFEIYLSQCISIPIITSLYDRFCNCGSIIHILMVLISTIALSLFFRISIKYLKPILKR